MKKESFRFAGAENKKGKRMVDEGEFVTVDPSGVTSRLIASKVISPD